MIPYKIYFFDLVDMDRKSKYGHHHRTKTQMLLNTCLTSMTSMLLLLQTKPLTYHCVCKSHYIDCLIKELGIDKSLGSPTYTPQILDNHRSVLCSFGISTKNEELDLTFIAYLHLYIE